MVTELSMCAGRLPLAMCQKNSQVINRLRNYIDQVVSRQTVPCQKLS